MRKSATTIVRGAIVLVPFPFTDLTSVKVRPALVISSENTIHADVVVLFISSVQQKTAQKDDVQINRRSGEFEPTGLKADSTVKCRKVVTLDRAIILGEIGYLGARTMKQVNTILKKTFGV